MNDVLIKIIMSIQINNMHPIDNVQIARILIDNPATCLETVDRWVDTTVKNIKNQLYIATNESVTIDYEFVDTCQ